MFSLPAIVAATATLLTLTSASPAPKPAAPEAAKTCSSWEPTIHNVFKQYPAYAKQYEAGAKNRFYVQQGDFGKEKRSAVIVFSDIPDGAKDCSIGWGQQNVLPGLNFGFFGQATFDVTQLTLGGKTLKETVKAVSWEEVEKIKGKKSASSAFETWPTTKYAGVHGGGDVECAKEMAFLVDFADENAEGMLIIENSKENKVGWTISYLGC